MTKPTTAFERLIACCQSLAEDTMCGVEDEVFADARQEQADIARIRELLWPNISGVIERDCAWEDLGLSYDACDELYAILSRFPANQ